MRIIPAIDLKGGVVVHAVAGRREEYQPLTSVLAADARPATVARGLIDTLGLNEFYVADLNAIAGGEPDWASYNALIRAGGTLWIDAGITGLQEAETLMNYAARRPAVTGIIVGLESLADASVLCELSRIIGPRRLMFSLDLRSGTLRSIAPQWQRHHPLEIAADVIAAGIRRLIVLDVAAVGTGQGCPTLALCRELRGHFAGVELIGGGGIRGLDDLKTVSASGCDAALVATALHVRGIQQTDVKQLSVGWNRGDDPQRRQIVPGKQSADLV